MNEKILKYRKLFHRCAYCEYQRYRYDFRERRIAFCIAKCKYVNSYSLKPFCVLYKVNEELRNELLNNNLEEEGMG